MNTQNIELIYEERINAFELKKASIRKYLVVLSFLRFLLFISFITSIVFLVKQFSFYRVGLVISIFGAFIFSIIHYLKRTDVLNHFKSLVRINQEEKNVLRNEYSGFYDGEKYTNREHAYSYDLDLFGEGSLYQYLNRTVTLVGRDLLAKRLTNTKTKESKIKSEQQVNSELATKIDWRHNFLATAYSSPVSDDDNKKIDLWVDEPAFFIKRNVFKILVVALPVITLSLLILVIAGMVHFSLFALFAIIQLFIASAFLRRTNKEQRIVSDELRILKNYAKLISLIENESFSSDLLSNLQKDLETDSIQAKLAFKKLIRIIDAFDARLNIVVGVILNGTLMWDLYSVMRLEKWKEKYGQNVKRWVEVIAEFDVYCSTANYGYNNPEFIYPEVSNTEVINAKELGHPLIPKSKRVNNDFIINCLGEIDIVTGANMAGKSTFLRTVGVNFILALNGMSICATDFSFKIIDLFSGMRTADSLKENESYFYAELKRLKYIIEKLKQGQPTLLLLDEILKGTNSIDKAKGSWRFVEHLIELKATGIIATHDLTLCGIETDYPENIKNKCFEVDIDGQKISFDYKLKSGVTQNMNATILMKQMGLFK
jgi:DNA mismatch repair ATPase MutS